MIPYEETSSKQFGYHLYQKDCLESKLLIKEKSVDLFFLDPPYFIRSMSWDSSWDSNEDYYAWCKEWISLCYSQLKEKGSAYICCQWQHSGSLQKILEDSGFFVQNRITWKRDKGRGAKTNFKQMHEDIWFVTKSKNDYTFNIDDVKIKKKVIAPYRDEKGNPKDWWIDEESGEKTRLTFPGNLWDDFVVPFWSCKEVRSYAFSKKSPENVLEKHPTQKPKDLVKRCILASSREGDLIVDYFGGSGTTLLAAKELNRNCIIFEKEDSYISAIETRLKNEKEVN